MKQKIFIFTLGYNAFDFFLSDSWQWKLAFAFFAALSILGLHLSEKISGQARSIKL